MGLDNFENNDISRNNSRNLLEKARDRYTVKLRYLSPELHTLGRDPCQVIKKMVECIPEGDNNMDLLYYDMVMAVYRAVSQDITFIQKHFWEYMGNRFLPERIGELDTPWKQRMIDYWIGALNVYADD